VNIVQNVTLREALGIFASGFVLLSMTVKSDSRSGNIRMRLLNLTGSVLMILYGVWIGSFSTVLLNVICLITHVYYLIKLIKSE
jgi:hypothetical protein